jgi:hypothetical protein
MVQPASKRLVTEASAPTIVGNYTGIKPASNSGGSNLSVSPSAIIGPTADMFHVVQGNSANPNRIHNANLANVAGYDNAIWDSAIATTMHSHHSVVGGVGGHPTVLGGSYLTCMFGYGSVSGTESGVYSANSHARGYRVSAGALGKTTLSAAATLGATTITVTSVTGISVGHTVYIDVGTKLDRANVASIAGNVLTLNTFQHVSTTATDGTPTGTGLGQAHASGTVVYWSNNTRQAATAMGTNSDAFGSGAVAAGDNVEASTTATLATGKNSQASIYGEHAHASGSVSGARGETQRRVIHAFRQITTTAAAELWAGGLSRMTLRDNTVWQFHAEVVMKEVGSSKSASWTFRGRIGKDVGNPTTAMKSGPSTITYDADFGATGWTAAVTADTANGALKIACGGLDGSTIIGTAVITVTEISG